MNRAVVRNSVRALTGPALASLRVVVLTYAGLGGIVALGLVVAGAVLPVAPVLHQATDPAGALVSGLVRPTTDAVAGFFGAAPGIAWVPQPVAAASPRTEIATIVPRMHEQSAPHSAATVADATESAADSTQDPLVAATQDLPVAATQDLPVAATQDPSADAAEPLPQPVVPPRAVSARPVVPLALAIQADPVDEVVEPDQVTSLPDAAPTDMPVVLPAEPQELQVAEMAPPKPLPSAPSPTETPREARARADAQNQAAIDAARAAQARARLDADIANQNAIAARQASEAATGSPVPETNLQANLPVQAAQPATGSQGKAANDAANQAAIDAEKAARTQARAQSNAANQAAIDVARVATPRASVAEPTSQPAASPPPTELPAPPEATEAPTAPDPVVEMQAPDPQDAQADSPVDSAVEQPAAD